MFHTINGNETSNCNNGYETTNKITNKRNKWCLWYNQSKICKQTKLYVTFNTGLDFSTNNWMNKPKQLTF
ncbi:MAG: hypothetical protein GY861_28040 [bacterium]|nr:hypothetical protein [bacterium]